jgi:hypothetical protein
MSEGIIDYQELEIGGQSAETKKGAKGAIKMFIVFRRKQCNDQRQYSKYSENNLI